MTTTNSAVSTTGVGQGAAPAADTPHWAALPIVLVGTFLSGLDFFIVNVAIPSVQVDLHATSAQIQLIIAGCSPWR
jgi:hypothetical protein